MTRHLLSTTPKSIPIVATNRASDPKETKEALLSDLKLDYDASSRLDIQQCDLLEESSISDVAGYCRDKYQSNNKEAHLRLGICLPGQLYPEKSPAQIDYDKALSTLKLNLLSPMMLLKHFHGFLPKKAIRLEPIDGLPNAAVMAFLSARVGSISDNGLGGWYSYRSSKAGLNQLVKSGDLFQRIASKDNACIIGLHPGTVKTNLSRDFWANVKKEKLFSPEFSVEQLIQNVIVGKQSIDDLRGNCWDWKGEKIPP